MSDNLKHGLKVFGGFALVALIFFTWMFFQEGKDHREAEQRVKCMSFVPVGTSDGTWQATVKPSPMGWAVIELTHNQKFYAAYELTADSFGQGGGNFRQMNRIIPSGTTAYVEVQSTRGKTLLVGGDTAPVNNYYLLEQ
jgi:hypothetical protein